MRGGEEVLRNEFFLLCKGEKALLCLRLVKGERNDLVRLQLPGQAAVADNRVMAVVAEVRHGVRVGKDLRAAVIAGIRQQVLAEGVAVRLGGAFLLDGIGPRRLRLQFGLRELGETVFAFEQLFFRVEGDARAAARAFITDNRHRQPSYL